MCTDIRPVRDSKHGSLPHVHLTSDDKWDPRVHDHEIDKDWPTKFDDPVEMHHRNLPHDRFGEMVNIHSDKIPVTRAEIEANATELITDELVGSVIECEIEGDTLH